MKELNKATSGMDSLTNNKVSYHKAIKTFINLRQGKQETIDTYMKRVQTSVEMRVPKGDRHVLRNPEHI